MAALVVVSTPDWKGDSNSMKGEYYQLVTSLVCSLGLHMVIAGSQTGASFNDTSGNSSQKFLNISLSPVAEKRVAQMRVTVNKVAANKMVDVVKPITTLSNLGPKNNLLSDKTAPSVTASKKTDIPQQTKYSPLKSPPEQATIGSSSEDNDQTKPVKDNRQGMTPSPFSPPPAGFGVWLVNYPRRSRELGEEGTVKIEVTSLKDSNNALIKIISSSGYMRLDNAALSAVASFSNLPQSSSARILNFVFKLENSKVAINPGE